MHTLFMTKNFPQRICGVGDYAYRFAEQLASSGESVSVLTEPADVPRRIPFGLCELPLRGWRDIRPVRRAVAEIAPDRVLLEYSASAWGRRGAPLWVNELLFQLRRRGIPVHVGLHELALSIREHPLHTPFILAQWLHIALIIAAAKSVAVNIRSRAALLERLFPWWSEKIRYRPNSSTIPVVPVSAAERDAFRRERRVSSGDFVVATFGLFHPAKNYEGLIAAIAEVRKSVPAKLWMLGDLAAASPEYIARLRSAAREAGIAESVWWPGRLDAAAVSRALQATHVFALPQPDGHLTRSSAFMAAAAHGLPVVAVRARHSHDQAEFAHRENVWLAVRSTAEDLSAGILAIAADSSMAARMGQNLRELYTGRFDWKIASAGSRSAESPAMNSVGGDAPAQSSAVAAAAHTEGAEL